jgi:hypothetical protein
MRPLLATVALLSALALAGCTAGQQACTSQSGSFSCGGQLANKSGTESHTWSNPSTKAQVSWGGQAASGSFTLTILDAQGKQVYSRTVSGAGQSGASGSTSTGMPGDWTVRLTYSDFTGQMGLSVTQAGASYCPPGTPYCP